LFYVEITVTSIDEKVSHSEAMSSIDNDCCFA